MEKPLYGTAIWTARIGLADPCCRETILTERQISGFINSVAVSAIPEKDLEGIVGSHTRTVSGEGVALQ